MSDSDSDDAPLQRALSVSGPPEWDFVPKETDFKLKIKNPGQKSKKLLYSLKKGARLPYSTRIQGLRFKVLLQFVIFCFERFGLGDYIHQDDGARSGGERSRERGGVLDFRGKFFPPLP